MKPFAISLCYAQSYLNIFPHPSHAESFHMFSKHIEIDYIEKMLKTHNFACG
jgi:hypothetical protein